MSLYWQQALSNGEQSTDSSVPTQNGQPGQWDYVNLGGAPDQQYQWANYSQQNASAAQSQQSQSHDPYGAAAFGASQTSQHQNGSYAAGNHTGYASQPQWSQQNYTNQQPQWTPEQVQAYYQQQSQANNQQSDATVPQHTPMLSKPVAKEIAAAATESLSLDANNIASSPMDGQSQVMAPSSESSQVTPESSYSVDTFASGGCQNGETETVNPTDHLPKEEEWDDWEQADGRETLHESSPSDNDNASQTQSEPARHHLNSYSDRDSSIGQSRESSVGAALPSSVRVSTPSVHSTSTSTVNADQERTFEPQPVIAQVAPLVKKPSLEPSEQPIARVEPVTQAYDSPSNVQRVAPTRTQSSSATSSNPAPQQAQEQDPFAPLHQHVVQPIADLVATAATAPLPIPAVNHVVPTAPPASEELIDCDSPALTASRAAEFAPDEIVDDHPMVAEPVEVVQISDHVMDVARQQELLPLPDSNTGVGQTAATPDPIILTSDGESPGQAQATSTPITANDVDRSLSHRRGSSSSVRSGVLPNSQTPLQPLPPGEQSDSTQGSLSITRNGAVRSSYHERYRGVKEKYLDSRTEVNQAMQRLDRHRVETPRAKKINPLDLSIAGRRSVLSVSARGLAGNASFDANGSIPYRPEVDKMNLSNFSQVDRSLDQSMDISRGTNGYGEDFVDAARRSRQNRSRPASRAKSEIGENGPYRSMPHGAPPHARSSAYEYADYQNMPQYYPGFHSVGRHSGRMSAVAMQYHPDYYQQQQMMYDYRRPQSSYDPRAMDRFQRSGGNYSNYDAFATGEEEEESGSESLSDEDEEDLEEVLHGGDSEDEMSRINMSGRSHNSVKHAMPAYSMSNHMMHPHVHHMARHAPRYGEKEIYFFGVINLSTDVVDMIFREMPPPKEFYTMLKPHEKAAYLYHASVYNRLFSSVNEFQNKFNREYYNLLCDIKNKNIVLAKICKSMYDEYSLKRQTSQQKAYEASQKHLFSDERDSADALSDRASVYDKDDDLASDIVSVDHRAPLKYRTPHAFLTFGPGGKMVTVHPDVSVSMVQIDDVKSILNDNHSSRLIDAAQMFRGPLITRKSGAHSVRLYIQRQIDRIRSSEVASENPRDNDVIDCLLVWQLLEMVVQQQGRVTGPDVARLLIAAGTSSSRPAHPNHREKSSTPLSSSTDVSEKKPDSRAYERFTQFLLGGHIDEAIECALRDGLYADAMVLARRTFAGDARRLAEIEARFLATRPATNPVMTLVAVASGEQAPILTNPPVDDTGSWRTHAAIVLANLNSSHAMETVYRLGRVLAKREYDAAADFCLLAVALLSNFDIFQPLPQTEEGVKIRQHITLIHASLPDDEWESTMCRYGFSLTDLHATEIFDYAIQLADRPSPLQNSLEFQRMRFQYASLLADYGGFSSDSFRYCLSVATSIWGYYHMMSAAELNDLAELADRLRFAAPEDVSDTAWIESLRAMIAQMPQSSNLVAGGVVAAAPEAQPQYHQATAANQNQGVEDTDGYPQTQTHDQLEINPLATRSRSQSLATEAQDWHDRQEPLQMSPRASAASETPPPPATANTIDPSSITSPLMGDYQTPTTSPYHQGYGQVGQTQQHQYEYQQPYNYDGESQQQSHYSQPSVMDDLTTSGSSPMASSIDNSGRSQRAPSISTTEMPPMQPYAPPTQPSVSNSTPHQQQSNSSMPPPQVQQPPPMSQPPAAAQPSPMPTGAAASFEPLKTKQEDTVKQDQSSDLMKKNNSSSSGFFSKMIRKVIPDSNSMKLPDDKNPQIRWDPVAKKWVGDGVEEETVAAPPPTMDVVGAAAPGGAPPIQGGGLRAARGSGGSRYFNPLADTSNQQGAGAPSAPVPTMMPSMPIPSSFGFIPTMPDGHESVDPFSGEANPTVHGAITNNDAN